MFQMDGVVDDDENAQSARELASKKSCVRLSCVRHRSDIELASVTGLRV